MQRREFVGAGLTLGVLGGSAVLTGCESMSHAKQLDPAALRARPRGVTRPIRLASNENPLGLSPAARRAVIETLGEGNRYPRQLRTDLIAALAAKHGVPADHVQLGQGSTEILKMAVHAASPDTTIVVAEPTYEDVTTYANAYGRRIVAVPLRADWSHDLERMRAAAATGPALVFICNPNNPTGTLTSCAEVDAWIAASDERTTFLVDEAYFEFAEEVPGYHSAQQWITTRPNVVIVRTFSKIHAMAGMRLGYALAQPATIRRLGLFACKNNVDQLALAAGLASLPDTDFHRRTVAVNRTGTTLLTQALDELGLAFLPSHANFVMHRITGELPEYIQRMRDRGINVGRPFPPLLTYSRVSIGMPEEMEAFVEELRGFRARSWV